MALVPSAEAALGLRRTICKAPLMSLQRISTSLAVDRPTPLKVIAWPALAEALLASAGVPESAVAATAFRLAV